MLTERRRMANESRRRLGHQFVERRLVSPRDFGLQDEMHARDRETSLDLFQRDFRRRVHLLGGELGLAEDVG